VGEPGVLDEALGVSRGLNLPRAFTAPALVAVVFNLIWKVRGSHLSGTIPPRPPLQRDDSDVVYRVDSDGRLTFVNDGWDAFAVENYTPELRGAAALGRPMTDFIAGPETRYVYDRLLARARAGVQMTLPFRCDSPSERRYMSMAVAAMSSDEVEFRSHLVEAQPRDSVGVLERDRPRSESLLTLCSWCNRGLIGDRWAEIEEVVAELRLFDAEVPRLTHGLCPDCQAQLLAEPPA